MQCPACTHLNDALSVRCMRCGSTLIHEAVGHSAEYQAARARADRNMYAGIGAAIGFLFVGGLLKVMFAELNAIGLGIGLGVGFASLGAAIGAALGLMFLKSRDSL